MVILYGLFVFIGKGYVIDKVVCFGFLGVIFDMLDLDCVDLMLVEFEFSKCLWMFGLFEILFFLDKDVIFDYGLVLLLYVNGMIF